MELAWRIDQRQLFGLTTRLLTTSSGANMGKIMGGAVWLNANRLSPYEFWQLWRNTEDDDAARFLRLFTELSLDEVQRLGQIQGQDINEAKQTVTTEVTRLAHGDEAALTAVGTAHRTFAEGRSSEGLPSIDVARAELDRGIPVAALFLLADLTSSKAEGRCLIRGGGARLNDESITDENAVATTGDLREGLLTLVAGRMRHVVVCAV